MSQMVDVNSPTWKTVSGKAVDVMRDAKRKTLARNADQRDADFERGRIAAVREILKLGEPPKAAQPITQPLQY